MTISDALWLAYCTYSAANSFIIGFSIGDSVLYAYCDIDTLRAFLGQSKTSDETPVFRLRVKPLAKKTESLFFSLNPEILCSISELEKTADEQYDSNRGRAFEALIIKAIGAKASPANTPFWVSGDCEKDGKQIQIKFQYATVIHENHMIELTKVKK